MTTVDYRAEIIEAHAVVWAFRDRLADKWPTPTPTDSLRFAACEAAEAMDAWLRTRPQYVRNRAKRLAITDELADCAMMLLTALGPGDSWRGNAFLVGVSIGEIGDLDVILYDVADALRFPGRGQTALILKGLALIAYYPDMPLLPAAVTARLERIGAKVAGPATG